MSISNLMSRCWAEYKKEAAKAGICSTEFEAFRLTPKSIVGKTLLSIGESLLGYWDSLVQDGWGSLDARALHPKFKDGTIREGFKRTWIGPAPAGSEMKIIVKKRDTGGLFPGTLGGTVTARKYNEDGQVIETKTLSFPDGKYTDTKELSLSNDKFGFIAVEVDTPHKPGKSFAYSIRYKEEPLKVETRKVSGFADFHVHQAAEYAFAGNWLHGNMVGDPATALKPCKPLEHNFKLVNLGIKNKPKKKDATAPYRVVSGGGYPDFKEWPHHMDIAHQQVHENWLKQAFEGGMKLMVSCAVNSEILSISLGAPLDHDVWRDMNSMELQIQKVHEFCERNSSWAAIAYNPWHARQIIHSGKLAIVLSVECSNIFPADKGDFVAQLSNLYCRGVRSIQIVHQCDNRFGGAAPQERDIKGIQTLSRLTRLSLHDSRRILQDMGLAAYFIKDMDKPLGFEFGVDGLSIRGLSNSGKTLVKEIMNRHMLLDVSHFSSRTFDDAYLLARENNYYPIYYSHTKFHPILSQEEREIQKEFLTTEDQLEKVKETGGMVGLRTAPWSNQNSCCGPNSPVEPDKTDEVGTVRNFAQQVAFAYKHNFPIAFGSDLNGFTNHLGPRKKDGAKPRELSSEYWEKGLCHIGMLPEVVKDLKSLGALGANEFDSGVENFLKMWERTWDSNRQRVVRPERPILGSSSIGKLDAIKPKSPKTIGSIRKK
ncbi:membrane dipeptidase [Algoriphagus litoralis]|uniref:membrane dipeptidase n=1 Tax=Algoriphagus litoralis TaxID=2202829 RepID=UPI000DBABC4B|nr:membrane dipeptidase [Algoriphagus litoralis]